jgi:hypothetical protein
MRIWSIHPQYLDTKGLVALWRETLLAKHVLLGLTKGYKNHPQLIRFKSAKEPANCINQYLSIVYDEATKRGYNFDKSKIDWDFGSNKLPVTTGQVEYETAHLIQKLEIRDISRFHELGKQKKILTHPLFEVVEGAVEGWEVTK